MFTTIGPRGACTGFGNLSKRYFAKLVLVV